jgi:hypothetical protein
MAKKPTKVTKAQALDALRNVRMNGPEGDEEIAKAGFEILNAYYWDEVRACARDYLKRAKEGEFKDDEELRESFEQYVDGAQMVIYTWWARAVLLCSNNPDAWEDVGIEAPKDPSQQAYFAFMADIAAHPDMEEAFSIARGEDE